MTKELFYGVIHKNEITLDPTYFALSEIPKTIEITITHPFYSGQKPYRVAGLQTINLDKPRNLDIAVFIYLKDGSPVNPLYNIDPVNVVFLKYNNQYLEKLPISVATNISIILNHRTLKLLNLYEGLNAMNLCSYNITKFQPTKDLDYFEGNTQYYSITLVKGLWE